MLHNAFLVHDDIEDGSDRRWGTATIVAPECLLR
jgi:geranylgeranyl pyrophosphate synthase